MFTWILIANGSEARLYSSENLRTERLELLKSFEHAESRLKGDDIMADRPGHYKTGHSACGAYERKSDPKEVEIEKFAQELVSEVMGGCNLHDYQRLIFVMPTSIYNYVKKHFDCHAPGVQVIYFSKDYTKKKDDEILQFLRGELYPQGEE